MDKLFQILPEDIVRHVMSYSTNPVCNDDYFTYHKFYRIHDSITYNTTGEMIDLIACYWNQTFTFDCKELNLSTNLSRRLADNQTEWDNSFQGMMAVNNYVRKIFSHPELSDYFKKLGYSTGKFVLHYEIANCYVLKWLMYIKELQNDLKLVDIGLRWLRRGKPYIPNIKMKKPALQELLTNNGITWRKSWNREKLVNAWYKQ